MDGDIAIGLPQRLDAWRAQGAHRLDPVRFGLIESLARRIGAHEGQARQLLDARLATLVAEYARDVATSVVVDADAPADAATPGVLGALLEQMPHRAIEADAYPELPLLDRFRTLWAGLRTQAQMRQSLEPVTADAGPLNSAVLVHRSLTLMRTLSPGYLQHFIAYVDALSSLERMRQSGTSASTDAPARVDGTRKPTRSRTRKKPRD